MVTGPGPHARGRTVAQGGVLSLAGTAAGALGALGTTVVVTRSFSPATAGEFFTATSLFLIAEAAGGAGAASGAVYFVARLRALGQQEQVPAVVRTAVRGAAVIAAAGAGLLTVTAGAAHWTASRAATSVPGGPPSVISLALALPFAAVTDALLGVTRGWRRIGPTVLIGRLGEPGLRLAAVAVAALLASPALLYPLWALACVPGCAAAAWWLRRIGGPGPAAPAPPSPRPLAEAVPGPGGGARVTAAGFWRFAAPRSLAALAQVVIQRLDIVLVGVLRGPAQAAVYTAATRLVVLGQLGNSAIATVTQPRLAELFAVGDRTGVRALYQVTTARLVMLTWPAYLLAIVFGPQVLALFGNGYQHGGTVLMILSAAMLVATGCGQADLALTSSGRSGLSLADNTAAMTVCIGLDLALIPRMGIAGAAIGWAAAIGIANLVPLAQVTLAARVHPFGAGLARACALTTLCFGVLPLIVRLQAAGSLPSVQATILAAGAVLLVAAIAGRPSGKETNR